MGSYGENRDLLYLLRSKSQIDCDSLDVSLAKELGPFADSTSNQIDAYMELSLPHRADILKDSLAYASQISGNFPGVPFEELALEIAMVNLSLAIAPHIDGAVHVMSNPNLKSTVDIVKNAKRITAILSQLSPTFPLSRLCIKVAATWEGLQACRELTEAGISTLATTLFTMEQAILAAECGCKSVSPFLHELKAVLHEYDDGAPNLALCREAQEYYKQYSHSTKVKAAAMLSVQEIKTLAGVASMTIPPDLLRTLASTQAAEEDVDQLSLFTSNKNPNGDKLERPAYLEDEKAWKEAFAKASDGKGERNTFEAIDIFREYQNKAEQMMLA